jgi:hypothetical protein
MHVKIAPSEGCLPPPGALLGRRTFPGCDGHFARFRRREANSVPLYYFKLVDSIIVADHGVHELVDDDAARVEAIKLARSLRETRPQLRSSHCSISVTAEDGAGVCLVALDET